MLSEAAVHLQALYTAEPCQRLSSIQPLPAGPLPSGRVPHVLLSTRLSEVRGFSDLTAEFFAELPASALPRGLRLTVLANKPSQEFRAFQVGGG